MRYIDADALMKRLNRKCAGPHDRKYTEGFNDALARFRSMVHSAPTISPDEVQTSGKWIEERMEIRCSACGKEYTDEVQCHASYGWPWEYCPSCGAKMGVSG